MRKDRIMSQYKAVVSDLDGTLLNRYHALSERTIEAVRGLEKLGVLFIIATGRHFKDVMMIRDKLGVMPYMITANGATVCAPSGDLIYQSAISKDVVKSILSIDVPENVFKNIYQDDLWLMERESHIFDDYYEDGDFHYTLCRFEERMHFDTNKIFFTSSEPEDLMPVYNAIKESYGDVVDVTFSLPVVLEVMAKGTNKGTALSSLLAGLGIDPAACVAFGDGLNDLEMLDFVGVGHIMGNGDESLKLKLPHLKVIGKNHEDAVARSIQHLFAL
jgi:Cof subfamily protein (haloacid dehalogenase superfamily)